MRLFGSDRVAGIMQRLGAEEGEVITHKMMTRSIEKAQKKVEGRNFSIRKRLLEYDDVMNQQRTVIYDRRRVALSEDDTYNEFLNILDEHVDTLCHSYASPSGHTEDWDLDGLETAIQKVAFIDFKSIRDNVHSFSFDDLINAVKEGLLGIYKFKEERIGRERMAVLERYFILRVIDEEWKDHLYQMDMLKEGIHLRAYGQKDPLVEYKKEAYGLFEELIYRINEFTLNWLIGKLQVKQEFEPQNRAELRKHQQVKMVHDTPTNMGYEGVARPESDIQKASRERSNKKQPIRVEKKTKPNDLCPCGSGKKYKKCHGALG
jgi:preprotein translocase subunit SecA